DCLPNSFAHLPLDDAKSPCAPRCGTESLRAPSLYFFSPSIEKSEQERIRHTQYKLARSQGPIHVSLQLLFPLVPPFGERSRNPQL
ncbi:hypothetical protein MJO28_011247, partial [Puccinia striiformis f. sp. tritici]